MDQPITDNQLGWISYHILRRLPLSPFEAISKTGKKFDAPLMGAEEWVITHLTKSTASDLINTWTHGEQQVVIDQLKLMGLNFKYQ